MTDETQQAQNGASQNPDLSNLAANLAKGKPNLFSDLTGLQKTALFAVPTCSSDCNRRWHHRNFNIFTRAG